MEYFVYYLFASSVCFFIAWRLENKDDFTNFACVLVYLLGPFVLLYKVYTSKKVIEAALKSKIPKRLRFEWK